MKYDEQRLEAALRKAPVPASPSGLEARCLDGFATRSRIAPTSVARGFWRRWWPVALPGLATAALAAVVLVQQAELAERHAVARVAAVAGEGGFSAAAPVGTAGAGDIQAELARLRETVEKLGAEFAGLEAMRRENGALTGELATRRAALPAEIRDMEAVKERSERIVCVNNLKQFGLAVRIWASDHNDEFPSEVSQCLPALGSPKALVCPADLVHVAAETAESFTTANLSYEFLAPGPGVNEKEPHRILSRCPIHRNVGLCDGSVQQLTPEQYQGLVMRDGKLYLERTAEKP